MPVTLLTVLQHANCSKDLTIRKTKVLFVQDETCAEKWQKNKVRMHAVANWRTHSYDTRRFRPRRHELGSVHFASHRFDKLGPRNTGNQMNSKVVERKIFSGISAVNYQQWTVSEEVWIPETKLKIERYIITLKITQRQGKNSYWAHTG